MLLSRNKECGNVGCSQGGAGGIRREIESKNQISFVIDIKSSKKKVFLKIKGNYGLM